MDFSRVCIYYLSSDGGNWAQYLQLKLSDEEYDFETILNDLNWTGNSAENIVRSAKLNIFLLTPKFLDTYENWSVFEMFDKKTTVLVLTGTDYSDLQATACSNNCDYIQDWPIHELSGDEESVRALLIKIIEKYEGYPDVHSEISPKSDEDDEVGYDCLKGITRQVNSVSEILQKKSKVYIITERVPEGRISIQLGNGTIITPECLSKTAVFRFNSDGSDGPCFSVLLNKSKIGSGKLLRGGPEQIYDTPYTPYKNNSSQTDGTNTETEGNDIYENTRGCYRDRTRQRSPPTSGNQSTESKLEVLRNILEEETSPLKLLCQSLNISDEDIETLDEELSTMVEGVEALRKLSIPTNMHFIDDPSKSVWPSLLHFGAQYNLKKFCNTLLDNRLMHRACAVPNIDGLVPHELAQKYGHADLAEVLYSIPVDNIANQDGKYDSGFDDKYYRSSKLSESSEPDEPAPPTPHDLTPSRKTSDAGLGAMGKIAEEPPDEDETTNQMLEQEKRKMVLSKSHGDAFPPKPVELPLSSPTKHHKKGGLFKIFSGNKKTKQRRYSEPSIPAEIMDQLSENKFDTMSRKKKISYKKVISSPSDEPAPPICMGAANYSGVQDTKIRRNKGPVSSTLNSENTNKRQSVRLNYALQDTRLTAPKLPLRK